MKIATRQSLLALKQAEMTKKLFEENHVKSEFLLMETKGDKTAHPLFSGKGIFVKELQEKLLSGLADIAVHSLKDLPVKQAENLAIQALLPRASKEDVLIVSPIVLEESGLAQISAHVRSQMHFEELKSYLMKSQFFREQKMGTSSLRRSMCAQKYFEAETAHLRGNVDTRLRKLRNNEYSCIILAKAGLERLGFFSNDSIDMFTLDPTVFVPSAGQGIIAIEARMLNARLTLELNTECQVNEKKIQNIWQKITSIESCIEAALERLVLFVLDCDCYTPVGVYFNGERLYIISEVDGKFLSCQIPVSKKDLNFMHELLNKNQNIYAGFFNDLCESSLAESFRTLLSKHAFL